MACGYLSAKPPSWPRPPQRLVSWADAPPGKPDPLLDGEFEEAIAVAPTPLPLDSNDFSPQARPTPPRRRASRLPQAPTRSYKGLQEDLVVATHAVERYQEEHSQARQGAQSLRMDVRATEARAHAFANADTELRHSWQTERLEASNLWSSYETPLQEQAAQLRAVADTMVALENSAVPQRRCLHALREECQELSVLVDSFRGEVLDSQDACRQAEERAHESNKEEQALQLCHDDAERLASLLRGAAGEQFDRAESLRAAAEQQLLGAQAVCDGLEHSEIHWEAGVRRVFVEEQALHDSTTARAQTLRREIHMEEQQLAAQSAESAAWRERALRSESTLCQQRGTSVAMGLRQLAEKCAQQVKSAGPPLTTSAA
mmetsp:Transcript_21242/g.41562  ORF Transcript_21242/g.41562 Transcript_21242/m.41562 type:complete len:374 (+) Transcript_21242:72-1193(+)